MCSYKFEITIFVKIYFLVKYNARWEKINCLLQQLWNFFKKILCKKYISDLSSDNIILTLSNFDNLNFRNFNKNNVV